MICNVTHFIFAFQFSDHIMDEVDAVPRPRRQRPKDSFQNELQSKLRQRKTLGLSADLSDTDEDGLGPEISGMILKRKFFFFKLNSENFYEFFSQLQRPPHILKSDKLILLL